MTRLKGVRALARENRGNIAITFAIVLMPLMLAVGASIDYVMAYNARAELQQAADAAALNAIAEQSPGVIAALQSGGSGKITLATEDAENWFNARIGDRLKSWTTDLSFDVEKTGAEFTSYVRFEAEVPTSFMQVVGYRTIKVSGEASAKYAAAKYIDFYMFLDNSPSMGLGATEADIQTLQKATANMPSDANCAFACHVENSKSDYYRLAQDLGVTTRIQMVAAATEAMIKSAKETRRYDDQYGMAVYSLGEKAQHAGLTKVSDITTDLSKVAEAAGEVDLMTIPSHSYPNVQTDLISAISSLGTTMGTAGSGDSSTDRDKVLFMVTDGVEDTKRPKGCIKPLQGGNRCQAPLDYSVCSTLKANGIRIAILYTTYLDVSENSWYRTWIKPFRSEIGTSLESCASTGLYFEVSPSEGISDAMNALFQKVINVPRLTM